MEVYCSQWEEIVNGVDGLILDLEYPTLMRLDLLFRGKCCFDVAFSVPSEDL